MDDHLVLDELMDFFNASDELALPTALALDDVDCDGLLAETESLLGSAIVPEVLPIAPVPAQSASPTTAVAATELHRPRSKDAIRRSIYRQRQKAEKEALRREIDELSAKLDKLQDSADDVNLSPSTDLALSSCLWKAIASRQKEHREVAETEHLHLRAAISSRAALIDDLCGVLKKRVHDGAITDGVLADAPRHKRMRLEPTDSALFEAFVQELHTVYLQTDEVLSACGLETSAAPSMTKQKDGSTDYYQHTDRQILPFKFKQVCHSMWHLAQLKHRQEDRQIYQGVEDPENTIALKFRITSRRMGEKVSLLQRVVVRRFQEINRVVLVWKMFTEGEGLFRGMHSDETGCNSTSCTPLVNEFTNMVVSTGEEENQTVLKALEEMLLDDTLANVAN
ncbi:uncharacterized protein IUM83_01334 [Phytophthora cinnamomi]|uniref:uncharacterized protein n=1 Tax=Phytophthora cinnamomi TaxID=4785 RepID=UPI0035594C4D|nr:hypothetical protein IUM83_01334 [Phytophthora cinnamomi]